MNFSKHSGKIAGLLGTVCGTLVLGLSSLPWARAQQPVLGIVDVQLTNGTNAPITYEVVGDTQPRTLAGGRSVYLDNLRLDPLTTVLFWKNDGLLRANLQRRGGVLRLTLGSTNNLGLDRKALTIESGNRISLY